MLCFRCDKQARGVCQFCGRAICEDHTQNSPYIITLYIGQNETPKAIVVADVIFCGTCKPQPEPIDMPELY